MLLLTDALATPSICEAFKNRAWKGFHMIVLLAGCFTPRISDTIYTIYPYSACVRSHTYQEPSVWIYLCSASVFHIRAAFSVLSLGSTLISWSPLRFWVPAAVFCKKSLTCALLPMTTEQFSMVTPPVRIAWAKISSNEIFLFLLEC